MSFTYDFTTFPDLSLVRLLVGDTSGVPPLPIWEDAEINAALQFFSSQNVIIGLTGYSLNIPVRMLFSHRRSAAMLLMGLGAVKGRNLIQSILDVKLDGNRASTALSALAKMYIEQEEMDGNFAVAEMVQNNFSMYERVMKMFLRQQVGS